MRLGINGHPGNLPLNSPRQWIKPANVLNFLIKELDSHGIALGIRGKHIYHVPANSIGAAAKIHIVARVL